MSSSRLLLVLAFTGCVRAPDSITVSATGVGADPSGIPQPHGALTVSGTWFLTHGQMDVHMIPTTSTTLPGLGGR